MIKSEVYNEKHKSENGLSLNADDCFIIGKQAYENTDFFQANFWLNKAMNRLDNANLKQTDYRTMLLDHLAFLSSLLNKVLLVFLKE